MSKKLLFINDFSEDEGTEKIQTLCEKYGYTFEHIVNTLDLKTDDEYMEYFLKLEKEGPDAVPYNDRILDAAKDTELIVTAMSPVPSKIYDVAKELKAVGIIRSGVENVNIKRATEKGIKVINCPERLAVPVSEYTVGLIIAEMKNIARSHKRVMEHNFVDTSYCNSSYTGNLKGRNVGIIGLGAIGSRVAKVMDAFEANVLVYDSFVSDEEIRKRGYTPLSLNELCAQADVITIHLRLVPETKDTIGKEQFALMKPTCVLINTARAGLVNEEALLDALINHKIGGAGLDVWHQEPLPDDSPLLSLDNVTLTAHIAGWCSDASELSKDIMLHALEHYFITGEWINCVNR